VPTAGVYVYPELLLRAAPGGGFERNGQPVELNGFSECCAATIATPAARASTEVRRPQPIHPNRRVYRATKDERIKGAARTRVVLGVELPSRWPAMSRETQNYVNRYRVNRGQFRFAPYRADADHEVLWSDIGGPYIEGTTQFNEAWWEEHRQLGLNASSLGWNIEATDDAWWRKYCKQNGWQHCLWPQADMQAYGVTVTQEHRRFVRKIVETMGCNGGITWGVGNEEALVPGARPEFFAEIAETFRKAEQDFPCLDPQGRPVVVVHMISNNAPEWAGGPYDIATTHTRAPLTAEIAGKPTELNEFNPGWPPKQWFANHCEAKKRKLAVWLWRDDSTDAELDEMLRLMRDGCGGVQACYAPDADDPNWGDNISCPGEMRPVLERAKTAVGSQCGVPQQERYETLGLLAEQARKDRDPSGRLVCAAGPWGDAVALRNSQGLYEEHHAVAFTDGCYANNPAVLPKWCWIYNGGDPSPTQCTNPEPIPVTRWNVVEHTKGPNWTTVNATPIVGPNAAYCAAIGYTDGRSLCAVRQEGDPQRQMCEAEVVGAPQWNGPGEVDPSGNPYLYRVRRGVGGTVTVCTSKAQQVCGSLVVTP
jgi:hypothetical protein